VEDIGGVLAAITGAVADPDRVEVHADGTLPTMTAGRITR